MTTLIQWSGDGLSGNLTMSSAGPGDTAPTFITGATPTIEPVPSRSPSIRFAQDGTTVNYAAWTFSGVDLAAYTVRLYVMVTAFPATDQFAIWKLVNAGETLASWALSITSTGLLRIMDKNGGNAATGNTALTAGTRYRIEGIVNGDACDVRCYEGDSLTVVEQVSVTLPASVPGGRVRVGNDFGTPHAPPFYVDDLVVTNTPEPIDPADTDDDIYATVAEMQERFALPSGSKETKVERAIRSASRSIDKTCGRVFYLSATATARQFYPDTRFRVKTDDFYTTTGLIVATDQDGDGVYEVTWPSTDYQLEPLNGIVDGEPGWPYNKLTSVSGAWFPPHHGVPRRAPIQVTAKWGWAAVPDGVHEACLIVASELLKLDDAPFGVAAYGDFGPIRVRDNPIAMRHLQPYIRYPWLAA